MKNFAKQNYRMPTACEYANSGFVSTKDPQCDCGAMGECVLKGDDYPTVTDRNCYVVQIQDRARLLWEGFVVPRNLLKDTQKFERAKLVRFADSSKDLSLIVADLKDVKTSPDSNSRVLLFAAEMFCEKVAGSGNTNAQALQRASVSEYPMKGKWELRTGSRTFEIENVQWVEGLVKPNNTNEAKVTEAHIRFELVQEKLELATRY